MTRWEQCEEGIEGLPGVMCYTVCSSFNGFAVEVWKVGHVETNNFDVERDVCELVPIGGWIKCTENIMIRVVYKKYAT